jgi:hypothetical protein
MPGKRGMHKLKREFSRRVVALSIGLCLASSTLPPARGADSDLNFKLYSPGAASGTPAPTPDTTADNASATDKSSLQTQSDVVNDAPGPMSTGDLDSGSSSKPTSLKKELPQSDSAQTSTSDQSAAPLHGLSNDTTTSTTTTSTTEDTKAADTKAAGDTKAADSSADKSTAPSSNKSEESSSSEMPAASNASPAETKESTTNTETSDNGAQTTDSASNNKVLQGFVRVVPSGTKFPIVMDTAVDSDTSQEGDEFSARTSEDLSIDGQTVVPAGSIIKGRIATLNAPKRLNRTGSVALKFDTITTPDNRQIPLAANLVARGGVVHARRGLKDIAIDATEFTLPTAVGIGIGAIAGAKSSSIGTGGGALIGAGVGIAVGLAILCAKKGKKVDVRPGDELKIQLAEDLRMPSTNM